MSIHTVSPPALTHTALTLSQELSPSHADSTIPAHKATQEKSAQATKADQRQQASDLCSSKLWGNTLIQLNTGRMLACVYAWRHQCSAARELQLIAGSLLDARNRRRSNQAQSVRMMRIVLHKLLHKHVVDRVRTWLGQFKIQMVSSAAVFGIVERCLVPECWQ